MKSFIRKSLCVAQTRMLSFFQASSRTVYLSSLVALLIAIALFPTWHQIFTIRDLPVQIKMAAPQEEYVRVFWDHPQRHPEAFERIEVHQNSPKQTPSEYKFSAVRTPWQRLKFVGENGSNLRITLVQVKGKQIQKQGQEFQLPLYIWNRFSRALATTVASWVLMTILFISTINIWQQKIGVRFSIMPYILALSTALSGFWMLIFYPGVLSFDAVNHWLQALRNEYDAWWPPILAMVMHVTQYWSKDPSLFTFIQGFLFWASALYLLWQVVYKPRLFLVNASLFTLILPIWLYSNAAVSNSWMAIFVLLAAAYLIQFFRHSRQRRFLLLSILSISMAICFRREAIFLVIIPIAIYLYNSLNSYKSLSLIRRHIAVIASMLLLSVIPTFVISLSPNVSGQSPTGYVFLSQYVGILDGVKDQADPAYLATEKQSIDEKFGKGTFDALLNQYDCAHSSRTISYFKKNSFQMQTKQAILFANNDFIVRKVLSAAAKHPLAYLQHKSCNFAYTLQIPKITYNTWGLIDPGPDKQREQLNIQFNSQLPQIKAAYISLLDQMLEHPLLSVLFQHYVFLIFSIFFLVLGAVTRKPEFLIPSMFSVVYPIGLIIPDSFPLWRYLFVCYVLAWICLLEAGNLLVIQGWQWWQRQRS